MPEFAPNIEKVATVEMKNPTSKAWDYNAELYLGEAKAASSGLIPFSIPAGGSVNVNFPITMPSVEGTYKPYIDVFSDSALVGAYQAIKDVTIAVPQLDFDLTTPSVLEATVEPGSKIEITCPVTSRCNVPVNAYAKVIIYEGSILPGHGTKIKEYDSGIFYIEPGESKNVIIHHTTVKGTIDRRDVEVEVYVNTELIKQSEWDDVYYVQGIAIIDTSWEVSEISGTLGGMLVKATISISSPRAFSGKITIAIPDNMIASNNLLTPDQHQALIDYYEGKRAECTTDTCRHHYDLVLESRRGDPITGGFYDSGIDGRETSQDIEEHHVGKIGSGVASKSYPFMAPMYFDFPADASQITLGFFLKADEAHYGLSDNTRLYCIGYKGGKFSPEVKLYEGSTLVDDVIYTDAISFEQWWTGNKCTLPWGAYPISAEVPATVESGKEFWASHTVYLTFVPQYQYNVQLYVPISGREWILTYALLQCAPYPGTRPSCRIRWLSGTGEVTFRGIPDCDSGEVPAEAVRPINAIDLPVPPGTYRVRSRCWKGRPTYTYDKIWDKDMGIKVTVI